MAKDLPIDKLLRECGFATDSAQAAARQALFEAGILNPRKERIVEWKRGDVEACLKARLTLLCEACRGGGLGEAYPEAIIAGQGDRCIVCEGSSNRRGALLLIDACRRANYRRVIIVGGSADIRQQVPLLLDQDLDVRMVDGTVARPGRDVQREVDGADVVILLGSTELNHTVSATWAGPKLVATNSRGISAFLAEAAEKIRARATRASG